MGKGVVFTRISATKFSWMGAVIGGGCILKLCQRLKWLQYLLTDYSVVSCHNLKTFEGHETRFLLLLSETMESLSIW